MEYKKLATAALIDKCIDRDPLAWAEFFDRFSPLITFSIKRALWNYCVEPGMAQEEAKEITQNIMASLWSKNRLDEVRERDNIDYWLAITARNATINHLKANRKYALVSDQSYFEKLPQKESIAEIKGTEAENPEERLKEIYKLLTAREKIIFKLYFKKELTLKDISKIVGAPLGTISSAITRMRHKIRRG